MIARESSDGPFNIISPDRLEVGSSLLKVDRHKFLMTVLNFTIVMPLLAGFIFGGQQLLQGNPKMAIIKMGFPWAFALSVYLIKAGVNRRIRFIENNASFLHQFFFLASFTEGFIKQNPLQFQLSPV